LLENESKLQHGKLIQANQTRNWIIGVAMLFLIIIGLLINFSRLKQRTNKKLKVQQTEISNTNFALQHLVEEKEWLVKEIHHRVKNNFHIVMGLLGTQSKYLKSEEAINAMAESRYRVHAMSLIHQKLYQSDNLSAINMTDYIYELVNYLRDSFNIGQSIQFNLQIDPVELDLAHCIPLGLIMNEAITNSIKYAFPDNKEGIIFISFKHTSKGHLLLAIRDNGVGLPAGFNTQGLTSMGMKLMHGLSEDIDGEFTITNHDGTEIMLDFIYEPELPIGIPKTNTEITNSI
jgi:two-component sensor histidine kinase